MPPSMARRGSLDMMLDEEPDDELADAGATGADAGYSIDDDDQPLDDVFFPEEAPPPPVVAVDTTAVEAAALVAAATTPGGVLSTYADESVRDARVSRARTKTAVRELKASCAALEHDAEVACRQEREELDRLDHLRRTTAAREAELLELRAAGTTSPNQAQVDEAEGRLREALATESAQAAVADAAFEAARRVEIDRDEALLKLTHHRQTMEGFEHTEQVEAEAQRMAAPRRAAREARAAHQLVGTVERAEAAAMAAEEVRKGVAEKQLTAARVGHKRAVKALRDRVVKERAKEKELEEGRNEVLDSRAEAVIALKESTEAAAAELRSSNARRAERTQKVAKEREEEKLKILKAGGNPYQVFRQRDEDVRLARERKVIEATLKDNMTALQGRIVRDYNTEAREREKEAAHVKAVEEKAKSISGAGKEQANELYMRTVTKKGVSVLDPTGREKHLHPSKVMTVESRPDWKFGLGMGTDPDVIDKVAAKYPEVVATAKEFAEMKADAARAKASAVKSHASKKDLPEPGAASVALMAREAAAREEAVDELVEAEAEGLWEDDVEGVPSRKKPPRELIGRELSVLEKRYMAEAAGRQKANQIVKQVVGGKEWVGPPFLCKPAELVFADFEVGQSYELKFTLTNVSYTFNMFRPSALPMAVRSFFELSHVPPGRMSAGVSCPLTLVFTPKVNEDLESEVPFMTSTGPMAIPLRATTKKCRIAVPSPSVEFGRVVMAEERTLPLVIHNGGALACPLSVTVLHETQPEADDDDEEEAGGEERPVFSVTAPQTVKGYGTTTVSVRYAPRRPGEAYCRYRVSFGDLAPDEEVTVHGMGVEVPIYLERLVIDMKCCAYGGLYREDVVLVNRSKVSHMVQLRVPRCLEDALEFVPSMGYVQARSSFTIGLKLRASEDLLVKCSEHLVEGGDVLLVPVTVRVPDQTLPVSFSLRVQLTTPKLSLELDGVPTSTLDFGQCPLNATRVLSLTLRNPSSLPQRFGFVPLPKGLDVQPGDGLGTILPGETVTREVHFSPSAATHHEEKLVCRTSLNQRYKLTCLGQGVMPPLSMSHSRLALPPTAEGDVSEGDVTLTNESSHPQSFELSTPKGSHLRVSPAVGTLQAGASCRLLVEFDAPVNPDPTYSPYGQYGTRDPEAEAAEAARLAEEAAAAEAARQAELEGEEGYEPPAEDPKAAEAEGEEGEEGAEAPAAEPVPEGPLLAEAAVSGRDEPWMHLATPTIACFVRRAPSPTAAPSSSSSSEHTLFLSVETAVVAAPLALGASGGVVQEADFGSVPVGQQRLLAVTVVSKCDEPLELKSSCLDPMGPFSLINALPVIPPRGSADVNVRYQPYRQLPARETLTLVGGGCTLRVKLAGQGVSPTLRVIVPESAAEPGVPPPASEDGKVSLGGGRRASVCFLGNLLVGDTSTGSVTIENTSEFALRYKLVTLAHGHSNNGALPPFDVSPVEALIEGGASQQLTLRFAPDHASDAFWRLIEVSVPNQEAEPHLLLLRGRASASAGFVLAPEQLPSDGPELMPSPARDVLSLPAPAASATGLVAGVSVARELTLPLVPTGADGVGACTLLVGHAAAKTLDVKAAGLEFSFEGLDAEAERRGFKIDPIKGSVKEGEVVAVAVTFATDAEAMKGTELGVIASFGVSQWAEAKVKCVLKGGNPPPAIAETEITLKGYIAGASSE